MAWQIRRIVEGEDMPRTGERQTLLFSATFPKARRAALGTRAGLVLMSLRACRQSLCHAVK